VIVATGVAFVLFRSECQVLAGTDDELPGADTFDLEDCAPGGRLDHAAPSGSPGRQACQMVPSLEPGAQPGPGGEPNARALAAVLQTPPDLSPGRGASATRWPFERG
jgi:hypothetical protein